MSVMWIVYINKKVIQFFRFDTFRMRPQLGYCFSITFPCTNQTNHIFKFDNERRSYLKYGVSKHASQNKSLMYVISSRLSKSSVT